MEKVAVEPTSADVEQYSALLAVTDKDGSGYSLKNGFPALGIWTQLKERRCFEAKEKEVAEEITEDLGALWITQESKWSWTRQKNASWFCDLLAASCGDASLGATHSI